NPRIDHHTTTRRNQMSVLTCILLTTLSALTILAIYLWQITPEPKDLAEEILRKRKPTNPARHTYARKPQPNMTHINWSSYTSPSTRVLARTRARETVRP